MNTIHILKTGDQRQVQFRGLMLGIFDDLLEAKEFALKAKYGDLIEVRDDAVLVEEIEK